MRDATKTVTVLFTDLVGSTAMSEALGPQEALLLTRNHHAILRDSLAVHRGVEVKSMGDGLMAVFGSVVDGIACAVTMQRAIKRHNRLNPERLLAIRIGLSVGEAAPVGDDWYGTPVVEAARLCAACEGGDIYLHEIVRALANGRSMLRVDRVGELTLKGLTEPTTAWRVDWDQEEEFALRVALAEDSVVLRQGIAMALRSAGMEVVQEASEPSELMRGLDAFSPHVVVLDVRMPPTYTTEGLDAAELIRESHPDIGVLVLSAAVEPNAARRLLSAVTHGVGYLLKDRITDMDELTAAIRTVASGGSAIDPEIVALLR